MPSDHRVPSTTGPADAAAAAAAAAADATAPAWCEIDLDAIIANARRLHEIARTPLVAMLKADAYGLGSVAVARTLATQVPQLLWGIGVASLAEARVLREAGITQRLLCCTPLLPDAFPLARALGVTPALGDADAIIAWTTRGGPDGVAPYHLAVDTGMSRAGVPWDAVRALRETLRDTFAAHPPEGVFTHVASPDDPAAVGLQGRRFADVREVLALPEGTLWHAEATQALRLRAEGAAAMHEAGPFSLARPGLALFGSPASEEFGLTPAVRVQARVVDVRDLPRGTPVSYDGTWTTPRASRIATLAIGYADGYRRHCANNGLVRLHGELVPVVGLVTMDMTLIDVTTLDDRVQRGDVATLIDTSRALTVDAVAERAGVSPYEFFTGLGLRLPRRYRGAGAPVAAPADALAAVPAPGLVSGSTP